jgi:hypothetical protein
LRRYDTTVDGAEHRGGLLTQTGCGVPQLSHQIDQLS